MKLSLAAASRWSRRLRPRRRRRGKHTSQTLGACRVQGTTPSSAALTTQPAPSSPIEGIPDEGKDVEGCGSVEVSTEEDDNVHRSLEKVVDA